MVACILICCCLSTIQCACGLLCMRCAKPIEVLMLFVGRRLRSGRQQAASERLHPTCPLRTDHVDGLRRADCMQCRTATGSARAWWRVVRCHRALPIVSRAPCVPRTQQSRRLPRLRVRGATSSAFSRCIRSLETIACLQCTRTGSSALRVPALTTWL